MLRSLLVIQNNVRLRSIKITNTGEVVETRGGYQKTIRAWKDENGTEEVESWIVDEVV